MARTGRLLHYIDTRLLWLTTPQFFPRLAILVTIIHREL